MATVEHPTKTLLPPPGVRPEPPVFVASSDRRARFVRRAGFAAALLAALWLVALAFGMLGLGRLPGVPMPTIGKLNHAKTSPKSETSNARDTAVVPTRQRPSALPTSAAAARAARARAAGTNGRSGSSASRTNNVTKGPATRVAPPASVPRQTGWARRGSTVPPGQARRTQPPPPPPGQSGQAPGQLKKTATTPPPPPPIPPGQQKPKRT